MKVTDPRPAHGNSAGWVERESLRRFPLDLAGRVAWIREMAETSISADESDAIYRLLNRVRNGK